LRFPGFEEEWERKEIGQTMKIGSGRDYKHLKEGEIPVFGTGGYMTSVNDHLMDGETVCIGRKGTINKPFYYSGKFWTVDTLFYTHSFKGIIPKFAFHVFEHINWLKYNEASGVPSLSKNTIEQIEIEIPSIPEQNKVGLFLSLVDERIQCQSKIIEELKSFKSEVSRKTFSQEFRFKDENGEDFAEWKVKKLGEVSDVRDGTHDSPKYHETGYPFITSKNLLKNGSIDFENVTFINKMDYDKFNGRSKVEINDILFGMIGTIGNPVLVKSNGFAIKNVALIKQKDGLLNVFLIHFLKGDSINQQFFEQNTGGTQKFLSLSIIRNLSVIVPSIPEQTKISDFLSGIDEKIDLETSLLQQLKLQKQYFLQQMFI